VKTARLLLALCVLVAGACTAAPDARQAAVCAETGRWLAFEGKRLQAADSTQVIANALSGEVVLLGEQHDQEDHHRWQLQVLAALHAQRPDMVIGFEMFPRRLQPVLDQWVAGKLTVSEFLAQAEWEKVWAFSPHLYLPLFEFARINRIPMRALNIEKKLTQAISEKGWAGVPPAEREGIGQAAAPLPAYREFLRGMHQLHLTGRAHAPDGAGKPATRFENFLDAQLAWDRAMAETLVPPKGGAGATRAPLMVGVMGSGHIRFGHGVSHQLHDLGVTRVVSLLPTSGKEECLAASPGLADALFLLPDKTPPVPEPPRLGVQLEDAAPGVRLVKITPGSLAEKSGLQAGDKLLELAGRSVGNSSEVSRAIRFQPAGTWLPLKILRGDSTLDIVVRFPPRP